MFSVFLSVHRGTGLFVRYGEGGGVASHKSGGGVPSPMSEGGGCLTYAPKIFEKINFNFFFGRGGGHIGGPWRWGTQTVCLLQSCRRSVLFYLFFCQFMFGDDFSSTCFSSCSYERN